MLSLSIWLSEVLFTFPSSWPQVIIKGTLILFCMRLPAQSRAQERLAMSALSAWKPQQVYKKSKLRSLETSHNHHCYFKTSRSGFIWPNLHANTVSIYIWADSLHSFYSQENPASHVGNTNVFQHIYLESFAESLSTEQHRLKTMYLQNKFQFWIRLSLFQALFPSNRLHFTVTT